MTDQQLTPSQEAAREKPAPGPIPTDEASLYEFVASTPPLDRWLIPAWMHAEHGHTPKHWEKIVDLILAEIENTQEIDRLRDRLREQLTLAVNAVHSASNTLAELASARVFDVEHAEGGDLLDFYLAEAYRALRTAVQVNPTRDAN